MTLITLPGVRKGRAAIYQPKPPEPPLPRGDACREGRKADVCDGRLSYQVCEVVGTDVLVRLWGRGGEKQNG